MIFTLHESVMQLLAKMYDPPEMMDVVLTLLANFAEAQRDGFDMYPFMIIPFTDEPPVFIEYEKIPETYIWN